MEQLISFNEKTFYRGRHGGGRAVGIHLNLGWNSTVTKEFSFSPLTAKNKECPSPACKIRVPVAHIENIASSLITIKPGEEAEILFAEPTTYWGRNKSGVAKGICLSVSVSKITIQPINSQGVSASALLEIPVESRETLIEAMRKIEQKFILNRLSGQ